MLSLLRAKPCTSLRLLTAPSTLPLLSQRRTMASNPSLIAELKKYSACDVSDALLKLDKAADGNGVPRGGFLADIDPRVPGAGSKEKVVAPAFTVLFDSKQSPGVDSSVVQSNIAKGQQWSDMVAADSVVVVKQPAGQRCAAVGGHHATRMAKLGARALLVDGRVRDIGEMTALPLAVWARGTSIVGAGAEAKPHAVQVPVDVDGVTIAPGDIIFCDPEEGAVRIPAALVQAVVDFLPAHTESEDKVKEMIHAGGSVQDSFAKFR